MSSNPSANSGTVELPTRLGRYEVLGMLAAGNMGRVLRARDPERGIAVAIKQFPAEGPAQPHHQILLRNEARALRRLSHPGVLRVLDMHLDSEACFLVLELLADARTLQPFTREGALLPLPRVLSLLCQAAEVLDHIHQAGVIHRDIKPSNLLLTAAGEFKLVDFSIAHLVEAPEGAQTGTPGFAGSPRYMAPEQIHEDAPEPASDLFSLAVVAYELLTGHHPFAAESFSTLLHKVVNTEAVEPCVHRPELPASLTPVFARALAKVPVERFTCAGDLVQALARALAEAPPTD